MAQSCRTTLAFSLLKGSVWRAGVLRAGQSTVLTAGLVRECLLLLAPSGGTGHSAMPPSRVPNPAHSVRYASCRFRVFPRDANEIATHSYVAERRLQIGVLGKRDVLVLVTLDEQKGRSVFRDIRDRRSFPERFSLAFSLD